MAISADLRRGRPRRRTAHAPAQFATAKLSGDLGDGCRQRCLNPRAGILCSAGRGGATPGLAEQPAAAKVADSRLLARAVAISIPRCSSGCGARSTSSLAPSSVATGFLGKRGSPFVVATRGRAQGRVGRRARVRGGPPVRPELPRRTRPQAKPAAAPPGPLEAGRPAASGSARAARAPPSRQDGGGHHGQPRPRAPLPRQRMHRISHRPLRVTRARIADDSRAEEASHG